RRGRPPAASPAPHAEEQATRCRRPAPAPRRRGGRTGGERGSPWRLLGGGLEAARAVGLEDVLERVVAVGVLEGVRLLGGAPVVAQNAELRIPSVRRLDDYDASG